MRNELHRMDPFLRADTRGKVVDDLARRVALPFKIQKSEFVRAASVPRRRLPQLARHRHRLRPKRLVPASKRVTSMTSSWAACCRFVRADVMRQAHQCVILANG